MLIFSNYSTVMMLRTACHSHDNSPFQGLYPQRDLLHSFDFLPPTSTALNSGPCNITNGEYLIGGIRCTIIKPDRTFSTVAPSMIDPTDLLGESQR
jgi:hypothetical protein